MIRDSCLAMLSPDLVVQLIKHLKKLFDRTIILICPHFLIFSNEQFTREGAVVLPKITDETEIKTLGPNMDFTAFPFMSDIKNKKLETIFLNVDAAKYGLK